MRLWCKCSVLLPTALNLSGWDEKFSLNNIRRPVRTVIISYVTHLNSWILSLKLCFPATWLELVEIDSTRQKSHRVMNPRFYSKSSGDPRVQVEGPLKEAYEMDRWEGHSYSPRLIEAMAMEAVMTLHGFGINRAHTTAMQMSVSAPVWNWGISDRQLQILTMLESVGLLTLYIKLAHTNNHL